MPNTTHSDPAKNAWYPALVSDRGNALLEELDDGRQELLFRALQKRSVSQWSAWLGEDWEAIAQYDTLSRAHRLELLSSADPVQQAAALRHHHAWPFDSPSPFDNA